MIRRAILALALVAGITPAFAQAPAPVPALPDAERRTSYTISASTCACAVGFALYGDGTDYVDWLEVFVNGVQQINNWTITSPSGSLATLPRPITDAVLTFNTGQTGTVQIVGARRPRRLSQFSESRGVAARDLNQALSDIIATQRETWDKTNEFTGRSVLARPGETMALLPALANRQNLGACFDNNGNLTSCTSVPSGTFAAGSAITFSGSNPTTINVNSSAIAATLNLSLTPQVRLTLASGVPVMTTNQAGASTIYTTPYGGCIVPIYDGTNMNPTCFAEVSQALSDTTKSPAATVATSVYDIFCWIDLGSTQRCTRGPPWSSDTARSAGTALVLVEGVWLNAAPITNGPAAQRGTYVGTIRTDTSNLLNYVFGAFGNPCVGANFAVFNAYNRVPVSTMLGEAVPSWNYAVANTWREIAAASSCVVLQLRGLNEDPITATYYAIGTPGTSTSMACGIGIDSTTSYSGIPGLIPSGAATTSACTAAYSGVPGLGYHTYTPNEYNSNSNTSSWVGNNATTFIQTGFKVELWQ